MYIVQSMRLCGYEAKTGSKVILTHISFRISSISNIQLVQREESNFSRKVHFVKFH